MTHDYKRHGTTDVFAALTNVATGEVIHDTKPRHTAKDVLAFFKWIDLHVPEELDIHVVLDNLSAHGEPVTQDGIPSRSWRHNQLWATPPSFDHPEANPAARNS